MTQKLPTYFFIVLFLLLVLVSIMILKPFVVAILTALILAFIFFPLYDWMYKKIKMENTSAFIVSLVLVLIVTIPVFIVIGNASKQVSEIYDTFTFRVSESGDIFEIDCSSDSSLCQTVTAINSNQRVKFYIMGAITKLASSMSTETSSFLFSLPKRILDVTVIFLLLFFLLKDGKKAWAHFIDLVPLKATHKERLRKEFADTVNGVVYGYLIISLIQGVVGWAAFAIIGYKSALLLGIIIALLGLIPMLGPGIVFVPAIVVEFFTGDYWHIAVILIAGAFLWYLDFWGRNQVIGSKTKVHPAIVALGLMGGILSFGLIGVVMGPLILSLLLTTLEIYQSERESLSF